MKKDYRFTLRVDEHSMRKFDYVCQLYNLTSSYVLREFIRYVARHGHTKKSPSQDYNTFFVVVFFYYTLIP